MLIFNRPSKKIIIKYQLATDGDISHVICVPGVTKAQIDALIDALGNDTDVLEAETTIHKKANLYIKAQ